MAYNTRTHMRQMDSIVALANCLGQKRAARGPSDIPMYSSQGKESHLLYLLDHAKNIDLSLEDRACIIAFVCGALMMNGTLTTLQASLMIGVDVD